MDLAQAIKERRSIRKFGPEPVSDDLVNAVLEAGRWAPSWANTQCWRFIVVRDALLKSSIADIIDPLAPPPGTDSNINPENPATAAARNAPVIIVVCGRVGKSGYYKENALTDKGDWYMFDTALAVQNIMLTAHSLGLGTVPIGVFNAKKAAEIVGLPPDIRVVLLLPLGYPAQKPIAPRRKELSEIAFVDKYG